MDEKQYWKKRGVKFSDELNSQPKQVIRYMKNQEEEIIKFLNKSNWNNILELGCGTGRLTKLIAKLPNWKRFVAIDLSENLLEIKLINFLKRAILFLKEKKLVRFMERACSFLTKREKDTNRYLSYHLFDRGQDMKSSNKIKDWLSPYCSLRAYNVKYYKNHNTLYINDNSYTIQIQFEFASRSALSWGFYIMTRLKNRVQFEIALCF